MPRLLLMGVLAAVLITLSAGLAAAQNWIGATSSDWTVGSNWQAGVVPTNGTVTINNVSPGAVLGVNGAATGSSGNLIVGNGAVGSLTIQNGSTLTSSGATIRIAAANGGIGTLTVTGAGSHWTATVAIVSVGFAGIGTLNILNGATVAAQNGMQLGVNATGSGTLNISGGGILQTTSLIRSLGNAQVNIDDGILRATAGSANFFNNFTVSQLNLAAGGLTFDTNGFAIGALGFSGVGGLTKIGAGTFTLSGTSTYTGATVIQVGTLALTGTGSIASSSRVVANATFDISGVTGAGTSIQSLAGTGAVNLGAETLTITNASDTFAGVIGGSGGLTVTGSTQTLSGVNTYNGTTTVAGGTLRAGAAGAFSAASAYVANAGGTLDLNGFDQTMASLSNAGIVRTGGAGATTLTVAGNYIGNGGTLVLNTVLGGDSSATDRMVVQGTTSGASTLRITNVGGSGAQTASGIKVIDVAGASNGSFTLQGDYVLNGQQAVVGGAYAYTLQKNGISTPTDGDWYLRSSLINPPASAPAGPLYQPGVPLYENYAAVLLGMNALPTLQQRAGNRYWGGSDATERAGLAYASMGGVPAQPTPVWGRIEGQHGAFSPSNTTGSTYNTDQWKAQAGIDGLLLENGWGKLIVGINAQYGTANANVSSFYGNGTIHAAGSGVGASLTWYGDNGFYVDGQAQGMFYRSDLSSVLTGSMTHGNEGMGYAFGIESGKRIGIGNGFALTPQAQLTYSKVDFDPFADRFAAAVSLLNADSLVGRAGLAFEHIKSWRDQSGQLVRSDVYGIANVHYEFLDGTNVLVSGTGFANANDRLWGSIGGGGTYSWASGRYAVFGEVSYNASLAHGDDHSYKGTAGFRVVW
ncbi:autotransporter outer membrane beta-barrel domain-containing protein [Bradyrhizobium sp. UNPA324]|uniref:autotransporter family protein n=1 Tax=Bradyrhizobium sp. UNPA324 TaxID=1141174 RepID=UPI001FEE81CA|nr:autotransporter outer membrane beta-barrel domain-containing protein [Bradyrhizobium sp. UNPA324]